MSSVGYVGLGNMGGALAERLQLTYPLWVFDLNPACRQRLSSVGATPVESVVELAERCDRILLCLPTSKHVRALLFGADGLTEKLRAGTLIIDQSTGDPHATRSIAAQLAGSGIDFIDAPVSGGAPGARAGTIAVMVGASPDLFERASPILSALSSNVFHAGGLGTGHTVKLVNNLLSCAQRLLTLEGLTLAAKNGVEPAKALEILLSSGGRNAYLEKIVGPDVIGGKLSAQFTLGLAHKDVRLACQLGIDSDTPMFFGNLTRELYQMCVNERGPEAQVDTAAIVYDRLAGTNVVPASAGG